MDHARVALRAHVSDKPAPLKEAPSLKIGGHPKGGNEPVRPAEVRSTLAVTSGMGGVGKSTVSSNLAVALAKQGRRAGLLDADIHGPSQPHMMGVTGTPIATGDSPMAAAYAQLADRLVQGGMAKAQISFKEIGTR